MSAHRRRALGVAAALGGVTLLALAVRQVGAAEIADGLRRVGWGLVPILALAGARFALRAEAWRLCMPAHTRLGYRQAFRAFLAGDAIGNVTPLGILASEPAKAILVRHHLATRESVASLALDNLVYGGSILVVLAIGVVTLIATVPLPFGWPAAAVLLLVLLAAGALVGVRLLRRGTWGASRGARPPWRARLAAIRESVIRLSADHPARLWRVLALDLLFHALAAFEVFLTLRWLLGTSPTVAQAIIFETLNRVVTVAFKFVPFRLGVDEVFSGALAPALAIDPAAGVTLAVVRKVRNLAWAAVGLLLVAAHSGPAPAPPEARGR